MVIVAGCSDVNKENRLENEQRSDVDQTEIDGDETESTTEAVSGNDVDDEEDEDIVTSESEGSLQLPEGFPKDFPLPDPITITEVRDESDEQRFSFVIRFSFDPEINLDETFAMYDDYAKNLDYTVVIGGEEYYADGIFQFGATDIKSVNNMFVVTLKPEGATYGDITLKLEK